MDVEFTPAAAHEYRELPLTIRVRIDKVIVRLRNWPDVSGVERLTKDWKHHARVRTGDYRVVFHLASDTRIVIDRVGHRRDVYFD